MSKKIKYFMKTHPHIYYQGMLFTFKLNKGNPSTLFWRWGIFGAQFDISKGFNLLFFLTIKPY